MRNKILVLLPFLIIIFVNELGRINTPAHLFKFHNQKTICSAKKMPIQCSWNCHNNTNYCISHHVKYLKPHLKNTDIFYNGVINILMSTGYYVVANYIFLVLLLMILFLIYKSLQIQKEINKFSK